MQTLYLFAMSLLEEVPPIEVIVVFSFLSLVYGYAIFYVAGTLNLRGMRTGYTRKIVHFAIFGSVALIQSLFGLLYVLVFGGVLGSIILYAIVKGDGNVLYESIAREKDAPQRTLFIVVPFLATVIGGLSANILFGDMAIFGYLVAGIGDAVGEPIGVRFGKHTLSSISRKTYEGSVAVFVGSLGALIIGLFLMGSMLSWWILPFLAALFTVVEIASPRGMDNLFLQFVPSAIMFFLV